MFKFGKLYRSPDAGAGSGGAADAGAAAAGDAGAAAAAAAGDAGAAAAGDAGAAAAAGEGGGGEKQSALMGGEGGGALPAKPDWAKGMSDENWNSIAANNYKSVDDIVGAHNSAQTKIGADKLVIPGEKATTEERDAFFTALGRPAEAKDYVITPPEGVEFTEDQLAFQSNFNETSHGLGLNQEQHTGLVEWNNNLLAQAAIDQAAEESKESEATKADLRKAYGNEADNKLDAANAFIENLGGQDVADAFVKSGLSRNFSTINMFIKVAEMAAGEGGLIGAGGGGGGLASIDSQIATLKADPGYFNEKAPNHKELNAKVTNLYKLKEKNKG